MKSFTSKHLSSAIGRETKKVFLNQFSKTQ
jgi:hypothetical protein